MKGEYEPSNIRFYFFILFYTITCMCLISKLITKKYIKKLIILIYKINYLIFLKIKYINYLPLKFYFSIKYKYITFIYCFIWQ